jgi:Cu(I)/Ag(I) efflux system membrane fusion protein
LSATSLRDSDQKAGAFRIVDWRVWILVDLLENEAAYFKPGAVAKVSLPQQNRKFTATVGATLPQFDPSTRTLKIRLEADNPDNTLRPDMFADVEYPVTFPPAISVPADAVLTRLRKTVFRPGDGFRALPGRDGYFKLVEIAALEPGVNRRDRHSRRFRKPHGDGGGGTDDAERTRYAASACP